MSRQALRIILVWKASNGRPMLDNELQNLWKDAVVTWRSSRYFPGGNQKIHAITQESWSPHWGSNTTLLRMKQDSEPLNLEIFFTDGTELSYSSCNIVYHFVLSTLLLWTALYACSSQSCSCSLPTIHDLEQKK